MARSGKGTPFGTHLIVHTEVLLLHPPIIYLFDLVLQETILYCAPPELQVELVRTMFATYVFYDFTHVLINPVFPSTPLRIFYDLTFRYDDMG